jgi:protein-S-isoprenylcysteine O-methyltransferase Ste14
MNHVNHDLKTTLTWGGIGPKLALLSLPYIILCTVVLINYPAFGNVELLDTVTVSIIACVWAAMGLLLWMWAAFWFVKHFSAHKLITTGPFALCRNPIYASIILFIIPALGVIMHSAPVLSVAVVLYIGFKISIHGECILLERLFGEEYNSYRKSVNEFFPFPAISKKNK